MSKTYVYVSLLSNGIRFANNTKITDTLTFTGNFVNIPGTSNGKRLQTLQNVITLNIPGSVLPDGCTDQCSALSVTSSIRVSFSAPTSLHSETTAAWEQLKQIVDKAIAEDKILTGFKPSANKTFVVGE